MASRLNNFHTDMLQLTGLPPFYDENTNDMYRKILSDPLRFPEEVGSEARSLLTALLNRDPAKRLGVNGAHEIKNHPFFARHLDFYKLWQKKIQPPFKPAVVSGHTQLCVPVPLGNESRSSTCALLTIAPRQAP